MVQLEIIKQCQRSCHLFEFFILNNFKRYSAMLLQFEKFEKKVCFFSFIFGSKMVVNTAEKVKYFAQN